MYIHRTLEQYVKKISQQFPVLMLTGSRQVGKTTLLKHLAEKNRNYVTLDNPLLLNLAKSDPSLFMQRFPGPILIDEIQYAPELLPFIKMEVDKSKIHGLFWLTGSQQFHLMKGVSESLAGRVGIINLLGLSLREIFNHSEESTPFLPIPEIIRAKELNSNALSLKELYKIIWRGSYPSVALFKEKDQSMFYSSYIQTYLQRDIHDLAKVGDEMSFLKFLSATAARSAQLLNLSDLARDADISPNTAKSWLSILIATGLVYLLQPYNQNITKRLVKAPKLYFLDTGLCAYLTDWTSPETLESGAMSGAILESWIMSEILKSWWHNGKQTPFYYYRDKDQKEIDLLIITDGKVYPIEFKKTSSPSANIVRHFKLLDKFQYSISYGGVVCLIPQSLPLTSSVTSIPAWVI
jgi:uncharacterized protein